MYKQNWKDSEDHWALLAWMKNPKNYKKMLTYQHYFPNLNERIEVSINRFINEGLIEKCNLKETISYMNKASDLKSLLQQLNKKTSGSKPELIDRLLETEEELLINEYADVMVIKCTDAALSLIQNYEQNKTNALLDTKLRMFNFLSDRDIVAANREFMSYSENSNPGSNIEERLYTTSKTIQTVFSYIPIQVQKNFDIETQNKIIAAASMKLYWYQNEDCAWLLDGLPISKEDIKNNIKLIERFENFLQFPSQYISSDRTIHFDKYNPTLCENCRNLDNTRVTETDLHKWPFAGCTNPIGCLPITPTDEFQAFSDSDNDEVYYIEDTIDLFNDNDFASLENNNFIAILRLNNQMYSSGKITDKEYLEIKKNILDLL